MTKFFFLLACLAVYPLTGAWELYCRWTDHRWPPGRHARQRRQHSIKHASAAWDRAVAEVGTAPEVA